MKWTCRRCDGSKVILDLSADEARLIGCLECEWGKIAGPDGRCVMSTQLVSIHGDTGRCTRDAMVGNLCWQHAKIVEDEAVAILHRRFRCGGYQPSKAYQKAFCMALRHAGMVIEDEMKEIELLRRAARLKADRECRRSVVYFVERDSFIKIGMTTQLDKRLVSLSRGGQMPDGMTVGPVKLLATMPGDRKNESFLHERFHGHRIDGTEWFYPAPELLDFIAGLSSPDVKAA